MPVFTLHEKIVAGNWHYIASLCCDNCVESKQATERVLKSSFDKK